MKCCEVNSKYSMYYNIWTNLASAVKLLKPHRYKRNSTSAYFRACGPLCQCYASETRLYFINNEDWYLEGLHEVMALLANGWPYWGPLFSIIYKVQKKQLHPVMLQDNCRNLACYFLLTSRSCSLRSLACIPRRTKILFIFAQHRLR